MRINMKYHPILINTFMLKEIFNNKKNKKKVVF